MNELHTYKKATYVHRSYKHTYPTCMMIIQLHNTQYIIRILAPPPAVPTFGMFEGIFTTLISESPPNFDMMSAVRTFGMFEGIYNAELWFPANALQTEFLDQMTHNFLKSDMIRIKFSLTHEGACALYNDISFWVAVYARKKTTKRNLVHAVPILLAFIAIDEQGQGCSVGATNRKHLFF